MKKIFTDKKEPLFGRADFLFNLKPFNFFETHRFIDRSVEDTCEIYAIFGGVPKYLLYTLLYSEKTIELIDKLFIVEPAPLMEDGKNILFCEVKWKNLSMQESIHILDKLKGKTKSVNWKNSRRVEHFAIIAKNIKGKSEIQKKGYLAFDLDDFKEFCEK